MDSLDGLPSGGVAELGGATTSDGDTTEAELLMPLSKFNREGGASDLRGLAAVDELEGFLTSFMGYPEALLLFTPALPLLLLLTELETLFLVSLSVGKAGSRLAVDVTGKEEVVEGVAVDGEWAAGILLSMMTGKEEAEAADGMGCEVGNITLVLAKWVE